MKKYQRVTHTDTALIGRLIDDEGFRGEPYKDTLGHLTVGYGTLFPLSREECRSLLSSRLKAKMSALSKESRRRYSVTISTLPKETQRGLFNMAYQLGIGGLMKFKKMWQALARRDLATAHDEALDSRWARQTPQRAQRVARQLLGGIER